MTTLHFILKDGSRRSVDAKVGASVMATAVHHNIRGIDAECGGACACATCHVYVDEAFIARLPPADTLEHEMLDAVAAARLPGSRLSCQLSVQADWEGLVLRVPETQI
jgi:ferredoxin, 2Fe-2S